MGCIAVGLLLQLLLTTLLGSGGSKSLLDGMGQGEAARGRGARGDPPHKDFLGIQYSLSGFSTLQAPGSGEVQGDSSSSGAVVVKSTSSLQVTRVSIGRFSVATKLPLMSSLISS